jgi:hypothetical protein
MIWQRSALTVRQGFVVTSAGWPGLSDVSAWVGSWLAEEAGEGGDGFEQQGVGAGLLIGGSAGAELGDGAAVVGLCGELADPGGHGGVDGRAARAARARVSRG